MKIPLINDHISYEYFVKNRNVDILAAIQERGLISVCKDSSDQMIIYSVNILSVCLLVTLQKT